MSKILEKIRYFFFGEKLISEKLADVMKDKNLTSNEKYTNMLKLIGNYFVNEHNNNVVTTVYELHYEEFVDKNNKVDKDKYNKIFKEEDGLLTYINLSYFIEYLVGLKLDENILSIDEKNILDNVKILDCNNFRDIPKKSLNSNSYFHLNSAYTDCLNEGEILTNKIKTYYKKLTNCYDEIDELYGF